VGRRSGPRRQIGSIPRYSFTKAIAWRRVASPASRRRSRTWGRRAAPDLQDHLQIVRPGGPGRGQDGCDRRHADAASRVPAGPAFVSRSCTAPTGPGPRSGAPWGGRQRPRGGGLAGAVSKRRCRAGACPWACPPPPLMRDPAVDQSTKRGGGQAPALHALRGSLLRVRDGVMTSWGYVGGAPALKRTQTPSASSLRLCVSASLRFSSRPGGRWPVAADQGAAPEPVTNFRRAVLGGARPPRGGEAALGACSAFALHAGGK
jgi:hypothetical protein